MMKTFVCVFFLSIEKERKFEEFVWFFFGVSYFCLQQTANFNLSNKGFDIFIRTQNF